MSSLDIVCPYIARDKDRFLILWESIQKFLKIKNFRLFLVSENGAQPVRSSRLIPLKSQSIFKEITNKEFIYTGWWKQQVIKLQSYRFCETECILSVDCDCFLNKNLYLKDLIVNNKPRIYLSKHGSWDNWYEGSSTILKLPLNIDKNQKVGVTPFLFSRTILKGLDLFLQNLYNDQHIKYLLSNTKQSKIFLNPSHTWSEYCLYHIYAHYTGLIKKYHHIDSSFMLYGNSVWNELEINTWEPEKSFNKKSNHFFTVFQSVANQPAEWVHKKIKPYLG